MQNVKFTKEKRLQKFIEILENKKLESSLSVSQNSTGCATTINNSLIP